MKRCTKITFKNFFATKKNAWSFFYILALLHLFYFFVHVLVQLYVQVLDQISSAMGTDKSLLVHRSQYGEVNMRPVAEWSDEIN